MVPVLVIKLKIVSDGKGGYRDKDQSVDSRNGNNELVFYDPGPTGGALTMVMVVPM